MVPSSCRSIGAAPPSEVPASCKADPESVATAALPAAPAPGAEGSGDVSGGPAEQTIGERKNPNGDQQR